VYIHSGTYLSYQGGSVEIEMDSKEEQEMDSRGEQGARVGIEY
jgi:hypothetical protein